MARPKLPKKNTDVNQPISPNAQPTLSDPVESQVEVAAAASPIAQVTKARTGKNTRKPEIVRANLVPINLDDEIRRLAYLLSERRGFAPGHETEDWLSAEREVLERYQQQRA
jgi:hypothetical protein